MQAIIISMIGIFLMIFILMPCYLSLKRSGRNKNLKLTVKGATTLIAVILSYIGYWNAMTTDVTNHLPESFFSRSVLIGLTICLFADVLLEIQVYIGGILFFLGHVAYIVYFIMLGGFPIICNTLYKETSLSDTVATLYYFSGQLLLALTIYLAAHLY